jgi:hypothetical protein
MINLSIVTMQIFTPLMDSSYRSMWLSHMPHDASEFLLHPKHHIDKWYKMKANAICCILITAFDEVTPELFK